MGKKDKIMEDYWKDFEIVDKARKISETAETVTLEGNNLSFNQVYDKVMNTDPIDDKEYIERAFANGLTDYERRNKVLLNFLNSRKTEVSIKLNQDMLDKYCFINGPILKEINTLRLRELCDIHKSKEYQKFVKGLPADQHITIDGFLIYRTPITADQYGLPGYPKEEIVEYSYDNPMEDITILFGTDDYCRELRRLNSKLISWNEFITKYYTI